MLLLGGVLIYSTLSPTTKVRPPTLYQYRFWRLGWHRGPIHATIIESSPHMFRFEHTSKFQKVCLWCIEKNPDFASPYIAQEECRTNLQYLITCTNAGSMKQTLAGLEDINQDDVPRDNSAVVHQCERRSFLTHSGIIGGVLNFISFRHMASEIYV